MDATSKARSGLLRRSQTAGNPRLRREASPPRNKGNPPPSPPPRKNSPVRRSSSAASKLRTTPPPSPTSATSTRTTPRREIRVKTPTTPPYAGVSRIGSKVTLSAWALSPGRTSATVADVAYFGSSGSKKAGGVLGMFRQRKAPPAKEREREEAVHELKLLVSRYVQWRFVNARAQKAMEAGTVTAQRKLFTVWVRLREMSKLVATKRTVVERLRLRMKLRHILAPQLRLLMHWEKSSERTNNAVAKTVAALQACCTPVPLIDGAEANVAEVEKVMSDALLVMGEIEIKFRKLYETLYDESCMDDWVLNQMNTTSSLLNELLEIIREEMHAMEELVQLSNIALALESQESSLRANLVQLRKWKSPSNEASTPKIGEDMHSSFLVSARGDHYHQQFGTW